MTELTARLAILIDGADHCDGDGVPTAHRCKPKNDSTSAAAGTSWAVRPSTKGADLGPGMVCGSENVPATRER
jgi:hypothetical protein